ncbi:hypothetical protein CGCS363_v000434 [Colletotrichum siamense]|uniref:uncharacterized protein n=1 Tax=Colletotrichum siamense TaxID=690259 RepID=UPI001872862B|nr:uncharacterized protein CGCS363_v000434 [Colletotrichum siamense]KAF5516463.1 hypothetical protein CGCS363_v000434 [Colletotrichum siamense]
MDSMMSLIEAASSTVAKQCEVITRMAHALATQGALSASQTNDLLEIQKTISKTIESQASTIQCLAESRAASNCDFGRAMPATAFPRFNQFQPEIRKIVWEMALPDTRVFMPHEIDRDHVTLAFTLDHKPPAIRAACKEAWLVTEENGRFAFGYGHTRAHGFWFNPSRDIVFVRRGEISEIVESAIKAAGTQNVAIEWYFFTSELSCISEMERTRERLKCRKVVVITLPQRFDNAEFVHDAQLFKLLDRDYVFVDENNRFYDFVYDDDHNDDDYGEDDNDDDDNHEGDQQRRITWARLKKILENIQSRRLQPQERHLVFEGMELLVNKRK